MGQVFINGQWVDDGKDTYFDAASNLRIGTQGVGNEAGGYVTPPGLPTAPLAPPPADALMAGREARYQASRGAALDLQAIRARNAQSDMPPGSPTQYLGAGGQPLGPVQTDELGVKLPTPAGAVGLRGYPTTAEITAGIARDAAQAKEDQFTSDINSVMGRYPAAPKFQAPTTDQLIAPLVARRNAEQAAVNNLNQRLQSESDQPVPLGRGRYGPSPASGTRRELAIRSQNLGELDRAQQAAVVAGARFSDQASKQNEIVARNTASGQIKDFLNNIDGSRYPIGSPEREKFIARVFMNRDDWLHAAHPKVNPELSKYVQDHMEVHRDVGATMQALKDQYGEQHQNLRFTPTINPKGGVTYRGSLAPTAEEKNKATLAKTLSKDTGGMTPEQFAQIDPNQVYAGGIFVPGKDSTADKPKGTFHKANEGFYSSGTPKGEFSNDYRHALSSVPGYKTGTEPTKDQIDAAKKIVGESSAIQIDVGKGKQNPVIPRARYNQYLSVFGNRQTPVKTGGKVMSVEDWLNQ